VGESHQSRWHQVGMNACQVQAARSANALRCPLWVKGGYSGRCPLRARGLGCELRLAAAVYALTSGPASRPRLAVPVRRSLP
jgi:hypothetical protein